MYIYYLQEYNQINTIAFFFHTHLSLPTYIYIYIYVWLHSHNGHYWVHHTTLIYTHVYELVRARFLSKVEEC